MKKIILSIIAGLLAAAMIMSLTACSIDIHTGNGEDETIRIDLGDIDLEEVAEGIAEKIEEIDVDEIMNGIAEKAEDLGLDQVMAGIAEKVEDIDMEEIGNLLGGLFSAISANSEDGLDGISDMLGGMMGESSGDSSSDSSDSQGGAGSDDFDIDVDEIEGIDEDITIDDIKNMDTDELLEYLKTILEANGMGSYYSIIEYQIKQNPEMFETLLDQYLGQYLEQFKAD